MNSQDVLKSVAAVESESKYSPAEARSRCLAFYESELKADLEPQRHGDYVVIDADSLRYEVDRSDTAATLRMLERDPKCGPHLFHHRIGYEAAYRIGFTPWRGES